MASAWTRASNDATKSRATWRLTETTLTRFSKLPFPLDLHNKKEARVARCTFGTHGQARKDVGDKDMLLSIIYSPGWILIPHFVSCVFLLSASWPRRSVEGEMGSGEGDVGAFGLIFLIGANRYCGLTYLKLAFSMVLTQRSGITFFSQLLSCLDLAALEILVYPGMSSSSIRSVPCVHLPTPPLPVKKRATTLAEPSD